MTVEKGSENENAIDTIRMLESRLNMKDGELQEREAEFKRIYEMTKKVSKQNHDINTKLRNDYNQLKEKLIEHTQATAEYMKYSNVILHHRTEDV